VLEGLAPQYDGRVKICSVNVDESMAVASRFGITAIPSVLFFRDGKELSSRRLVGAQPAAQYRAVIEELLAGEEQG